MIIASAIKFFYKEDTEHRFPQIWTGLRHADIFERMFKMGVEYDKESHIQGFVTDDNRFLNRYEARHEAVECRQVDPLFFTAGALYSEDLWPEE